MNTIKKETSTKQVNVAEFAKARRKKGIVMGALAILGVAFAIVLGFSAMSNTGERLHEQAVTESTLRSSETGSCVYGSATNITCRITAESTCKQRNGFWSRQGTCDFRQSVETKKQK